MVKKKKKKMVHCSLMSCQNLNQFVSFKHALFGVKVTWEGINLSIPVGHPPITSAA